MTDWGIEAWMDDAACATTYPDAWFPEWGGNDDPAKRVCRDCPARTACLNYAIEHRITEGIWGGLSPRQRRRTITKRNRTEVST